MLNIQNLIILIVLLATTLVNSMHQPGTSSGSSRAITEEDIQEFENRVEHYRQMPGGIVNHLRIDHLKSWSHWNRTSDVFKKNCVLGYELGAELTDRVGVPTADGLGRMAYYALTAVIQEASGKDMDLLANTNHPELREKMYSIVRKGEYLRFAAYFHSAPQNTMQRLVKELRANEPNLTDEQEKLITFLQEYLTEFPSTQ